MIITWAIPHDGARFILFRLAVVRREMGRKRKKVLRPTRKSLPKVFSCPRCGVVAVRITSQRDEASQDYVMVVACGNSACKLRREFRYAVERPEIDVYNSFVDEFVKTGA